MLIKGDKLTDKQRQTVLRAFVHRNTVEHPYHLSGGNGKQTDAEYLSEHAFYFVKDGSRLSVRHQHCEPAYLAD